MTEVRVTHIGGPTTLIEFGGWRLLTDPTFDPAGGARRLGAGSLGLKPWQSTELRTTGKPAIDVTATPCRHGPPLSRPITGEVAGFALRWPGQRHGALWVTGDTVYYRGLRQAAARLEVSLMLLHLGSVRFPVTGPLRYTMTAAQGVRLCGPAGARTVIPVHYEGRRHFREGRAGIESAFSQLRGEHRQPRSRDGHVGDLPCGAWGRGAVAGEYPAEQASHWPGLGSGPWLEKA